MIYTISTDVASAKVDLVRLQDEIEASAITPTLSLIRVDGDILTIEFSAAISSEETTTLTALINAHSGEPYPEETAPTQVKVVQEVPPPPFSSKVLTSGQKLFKRVHGVQHTVAANTTQSISFIVPYTQAKINGLQIIGASLGDTANFKVYDNNLGTVSTIPNLLLNQFGFNVCLAERFHVEESQYDADVLQGMRLELEFTNSTNSEVVIGANFIIHEVR